MFLFSFPGTVFTEYVEDGETKGFLYLEGSVKMPSTVTFPNPIPHLILRNDAEMEVQTDLRVTSLGGDGSAVVTIKNGNTLTVDGLHTPALGSRCSFTIEEGGTLNTASVDDFVINADQKVQMILGNYIGNGLTLPPKTELTISATGELDAMNLRLMTEARVNVASGGKLGGDAEINLLSLGPSSVLYFDEESLSLAVTELEMMLGATLQSNSDLKNWEITCDSFTMFDFALLDLSVGGVTDGEGSCDATTGATFGGQGGSSEVIPFGSVINPDKYGSGCGDIRGGGKVVINVQNSLIIDGSVKANGANGTSTGGAAGGTIVINANSLSGHGDIAAEGGNGPSSAGGGGGGRIAVVVQSFEFIGRMSTKGGFSEASPGAAGTVYLSYKEVSDQKWIKVDNDGQLSPSFTALTDGFDGPQLSLTGHAKIQFISTDTSEFTIDTIIGDLTAEIMVQDGQTVNLATTKGIQSAYVLPCKVNVPQGAIANLSPKILLQNPNGDSDTPSITLGGTLKKVTSLSIAKGGSMEVTSSASYNDGPASELSFVTVDVINGGILNLGLETDQPFKLRTYDSINVHYGGRIVGRNLLLETPALSVSVNGYVSVDGMGLEAEAGDGAGQEGKQIQFCVLFS